MEQLNEERIFTPEKDKKDGQNGGGPNPPQSKPGRKPEEKEKELLLD